MNWFSKIFNKTKEIVKDSVSLPVRIVECELPKGIHKFQDREGKFKYVDFDKATQIFKVKYMRECPKNKYDIFSLAILGEFVISFFKTSKGHYIRTVVDGRDNNLEIDELTEDEVKDAFVLCSENFKSDGYKNYQCILIDETFKIDYEEV